ncbi:MAG: hypothetical protein ABSE73_13515, partial [Planctomycetota bacterium]
NCYAMVEYVKAGGAVLFTGGEYAFGKGGYNYTVLERELLPVLCVENVDTRYSEAPLPLEPAKDFAELTGSAGVPAGPGSAGVPAGMDFAAKPSFWVWNQVALKSDPAVKVFLKSGSRPVLVGWQVGKGRVACLLLDHRGKSEPGVTAFFDWAGWPALLHAVFAWLAPDASKVQPRAAPELSAAEARKLLDQLEGDSMEDAVAGLEKDTAGVGGLPAAGGAGGGVTGAALRKRVASINRALQASGKEAAGVLAQQLATVSALPLDTRWAILDFLRAQPPAQLADMGRTCLAAKDSGTRGCGMQVLALAGDAAFPKELAAPAQAMETDPQGLSRDLALALVLYAKPGLVDEGKRRVLAWNAKENEAMLKWTEGKGFSPAAPEHPCLDGETLLQRVAWLAYLSRHEPASFGTQFAKEWLMCSEYQDYCDRSQRNLWSDHMTAADRKRAEIKGPEWQRFRAYFGRLRELARPDVEALVKNAPEVAAPGLAKAHFTLEFRSCMNLLGGLDRAASGAILEKLKKADNADLAEFAAARAKGK